MQNWNGHERLDSGGLQHSMIRAQVERREGRRRKERRKEKRETSPPF
jgi:hypothetical protein